MWFKGWVSMDYASKSSQLRECQAALVLLCKRNVTSLELSALRSMTPLLPYQCQWLIVSSLDAKLSLQTAVLSTKWALMESLWSPNTSKSPSTCSVSHTSSPRSSRSIRRMCKKCSRQKQAKISSKLWSTTLLQNTWTYSSPTWGFTRLLQSVMNWLNSSPTEDGLAKRCRTRLYQTYFSLTN